MKQRKRTTEAERVTAMVKVFARENGLTAAQAVRELIERGLMSRTESNPQRARRKAEPVADLSAYSPEMRRFLKIVLSRKKRVRDR